MATVRKIANQRSNVFSPVLDYNAETHRPTLTADNIMSRNTRRHKRPLTQGTNMTFRSSPDVAQKIKLSQRFFFLLVNQ